jgi:hypothetical protein
MLTNQDTDRAYLAKQRDRYQEFQANGQTSSALDALWRGASAADLLTADEYRHSALTSDRIAALLGKLGWE